MEGLNEQDTKLNKLEIENLKQKKTELNFEMAKLDTLIKEKEEKTLIIEYLLQRLIVSLNTLKTLQNNHITQKKIDQLTSGTSLLFEGKDH